MRRREINLDLLSGLQSKPHPHQTAGSPDLPTGAGEILQEALVAQHLLDMAGVPYEKGYRGDVDARVFLLVVEAFELRDRLSRIAAWHSRETAEGGMVGDFCVDCDQRWPCETRRMADGSHEDLDVNAGDLTLTERTGTNGRLDH